MSALESNPLNRQLQQAVRQVEQVQRFQELVHRLTSRCWDLCVDKPGIRLGSSTETCLANCVGRFIDTSTFIANRMEEVVTKSSANASSFD